MPLVQLIQLSSTSGVRMTETGVCYSIVNLDYYLLSKLLNITLYCAHSRSPEAQTCPLPQGNETFGICETGIYTNIFQNEYEWVSLRYLAS